MKAGDVLVYYSPVESIGDRDPLREFTALGVIEEGEIWQADEGCFKPFRRRVRYEQFTPVPLGDVRSRLAVTSTPNWGYQLRRGLIPLDGNDVEILRSATS